MARERVEQLVVGLDVGLQPALAGDGLEQAAHQEGQVVEAVAQGGHAHLDDREAVEEIGAEAPGVDLATQVAVGGGDDAHVDALDALAADAADLALAQGAQQLGLQLQRQLPQLVEEDGAAVRPLERALRDRPWRR